jgi:hypothetical protein
MTRITKEQAAILSAHTGILCGSFSDFHEYVERILGRPVFTHEMGSPEFFKKLKEKSRDDFLLLVAK